MKQISLLFTLVAVIVGLPAQPALAAMTQWHDLGGGKARLVASLDPADGAVKAVVEVALEPGWKTYWREPGGSGIPPVFDFSRSVHFVAGEARFPVPDYLVAGGIRFPGYRGNVRFVIDGKATRLDPAGEIRLDLLIGICEEVCIPASASMSLPFDKLMGNDAATELLMAEAAAKLPGPANDSMHVTDVSRGDGDSLRVSAQLPGDDGNAALFVQGPGGWYVSPADLISRKGRKAVFGFPAKPPKSASPVERPRFHFTLVADGHAVEQSVVLPADQ